MSDNAAEQDVIQTHNLFWKAFAERNIRLRFSVIDDAVTFIGTGLHESAANKEEYKKINERGVEQYPLPMVLEFLWTRVSVFKEIAWVESEVIWKQMIGEKENKDIVRTTVIFKRERDKWWVVHVHGSNPDYRFGEGEFILNETTIERNRELEKQVFERTQELNRSLQDLKAAQTQLIQSEKMASLGELTVGIAHEIQNPLNFVNNFSEVSNELLDEMENALQKNEKEEAIKIASDIKINLQKIAHHGKRADAIVKGMLQHSRTSSGKKEATDINALADEYLRLSFHGLRAKDKTFNANFTTDFDATIGDIEIVPQDVGRVLLNLYTNAFYAVTEKKKLHPNGYDPTVSVTTKKIGNKIEVRVNDNGSGIPQKVLEKIYQPFFTTKPTGQGTGLGLSLSYDIIKAHNGEIKVETKEGEGATFIIHLPLK